MPELFRLYASEKASPPDKNGNYIQSPEEAGQYLLPQFIGRTNEVVLLVCLDNKGKVLLIAFSCCASFALGDHLGFCAGVEPDLIAPMVIAKLAGGVLCSS